MPNLTNIKNYETRIQSRNDTITSTKDDGVRASSSSCSKSPASGSLSSVEVTSANGYFIEGSASPSFSFYSSNASTASTAVSTDVSESSDAYYCCGNSCSIVHPQILKPRSSSWPFPPSQLATRRQRHQRKGVSWSDQARVHPTLPRSEYSEDEKCAAFFQREDYDQITRECVKQVTKMINGEKLKDKKYSSRGLEGHMKLAYTTKQSNRQAAYAAVLDEQDEQFKSQIIDEEAIAELYISVSLSCQLWASVIGLRDQKASEEYLFSIDD